MLQNNYNIEPIEISKEKIVFLRTSLKNQFSTLKNDFNQHPNTSRLFKHHRNFIDQLLITLWRDLHIEQGCCLIAVGGYGRGELFPHSDIDLLILMPTESQENQSANKSIEYFIGLMWDLGLNIGHSVRNLEECIDEAKKDITVQTNILESRLLAGSDTMYQSFVSNVAENLNLIDFFKAKLKEQEQRYAKFNDTAYNLEPNIKESPGGLRDLHMIVWITRSLQIKSHKHSAPNNFWMALAKDNVISIAEARRIRHHEKKLALLRIHLHFLSGRREDRLLFDFQNDLATILGYKNTYRRRASEQLMQNYYRSVKFIGLMNEIILKLLKITIMASAPVVHTINHHFESHNDLLEAKSSNLLQENPTLILEAFLLLQQHPEVSGLGATLLRTLQRIKPLVNKDFRDNAQNKKLFIAILSEPSGVNRALHAMNRYGILGSYIPAFGKIIGQMQHDLFHVYTVDEHILNVLANLRRFAKLELKHEFPLCSKIFSEFDAPYLLYLAALFHDIAKGRGGDHSTLGMVDATKFCKLHFLQKEDIALVSWLVEAHLKMSTIAQKTDLSDPNIIESFASFVENKRRLDALYLLTVADIRGTSPAVWNAWKSRLLENLYAATSNALSKPEFHVKQTIQQRIKEASEKLDRFGLSKHSYEQLWQEFGEQYFVRHESDDIAWHSRLLTPHLYSETPIVRAKLSSYGDGIQIMIYIKDINDLFAKICNFFDRMAYSIVEAKIFTTSHGYALNSFIVLDQSGKSVSYNGLLKFIELELTNQLHEHYQLESPLKGRLSRQVKHMPIQAQITITEDTVNNNYTLNIIANDRPGLLATIAQQFLKHNIKLHNAKINTLGNRAEDTFLISSKNDNKLDFNNVNSLQVSLLDEI